MRYKLCLILALTSLLAAGEVVAQTQLGDTSLDTTARSTDTPAKERMLRLLDDAQSVARYVGNEPAFLVALGQVRQGILVADESQLEPLERLEPHFSNLHAILARMRARIGSVRDAVELCDGTRLDGRALFHLLLDTLDAEGERVAASRICDKLASPEGIMSQVCVATELTFLVVRGLHDVVMLCDRAIDDGAIRDDSVQRMATDVRESVGGAKQELTHALTAVAGHLADVSSVNSTSLETAIRASRDLYLRFEIEKALDAGRPYGILYLPRKYGGQLEIVRRIVIETIQNVAASGEKANGASAKLASGDGELADGHYKKAFRLYSEAYVTAVGIAGGAP